jgi:pimeloyl-ACP methyl ester carboxylesterase
VERGEGPPLVMLHGNGGMIQELALSGLFELATARYRVIVLDRPGYGYSARPRLKWWGRIHRPRCCARCWCNSPRAGHMVHHTDPRRVLQAIEAAAR